ncbi:MAG TPA: tetratricopeptide repeat protein [Gemmatimonadales bacterium]|nr:tetratricopeptide repeat protein [Gemmatimonadales bacterium]
MNYWKGLMIAAAIDLGWIMGCPVTATGPEAVPPLDVVAEWPQPVDELTETGRLEDSLMSYLQQSPEDVVAMAKLARIYTDQGWYDAAINPLARALQIDPQRRSLWSALDRAVEKSGKAKITDAELTRRAAAFVEAVEMWGHGC